MPDSFFCHHLLLCQLSAIPNAESFLSNPIYHQHTREFSPSKWVVLRCKKFSIFGACCPNNARDRPIALSDISGLVSFVSQSWLSPGANVLYAVIFHPPQLYSVRQRASNVNKTAGVLAQNTIRGTVLMEKAWLLYGWLQASDQNKCFSSNPISFCVCVDRCIMRRAASMCGPTLARVALMYQSILHKNINKIFTCVWYCTP